MGLRLLQIFKNLNEGLKVVFLLLNLIGLLEKIERRSEVTNKISKINLRERKKKYFL